MNKNLAFFLFAIGGVALGFFGGRALNDNPQLIEPIESSSAKNDPAMTSSDLVLENEKLRAQLKILGDTPIIPFSEEESVVEKKMTDTEILIALSRAANDPNPITRSQVFSDLLEKLNPENLEAVLEVYQNMPMGFESMHEYRLLMYAWGKFDAPSAIEYVNGRNLGRGGAFAATGAMEGWASQNPQAAIEWNKAQENQRAAKIYNFGIVRGLASHDVTQAADYVTTLEDGWEKSRMVGVLTSQFLKEGFSSARNWAENLEDENFKSSAFSNLSRQQARDNPNEVAAWLKDHAGQKYSEDSFDELGENWGRQDPVAAIEYFETLPDGEGRRQGMLEVVEAWSRKDSEATENWLREQSQSGQPVSELDEAIGEYAREISRENGEKAMDWAVAIQDEEVKEKTIARVGQNWMRQDEEAAKAWLPNSGLTEEMQKTIATPPQSSRGWSGGPRGGPR
jgi:hypothetical protein